MKFGSGMRRSLAPVLVIEAVLVAAVAVVAAWPADRPTLPGPQFVDIRDVPARPAPPRAAPGGATGSFTWSCGRNEEGHRNSANVVVAPRWTGPAHHTHEYVGNLAVDSGTLLDRLPEGPTTCANGDNSTYYWPVLRTRSPGGAHGTVQAPAEVTLSFRGNPTAPVVAMPALLRGTVGDAFAVTGGGARARATWGCVSMPDRRTTRYPVCPRGDRVLRVFDFPSCWDGARVDSHDHRAHLVESDPAGVCPHGTFAVPRLRLSVAYRVPPGTSFVIDGFPNQRHSPLTDHAFFVNAMPERLMAEVVRCLNTGSRCGSAAPG